MLDVIVLNVWRPQTRSKASCLPPIPPLIPRKGRRKQGWDWRETGSFTPSLEAPRIQHNDIQHNDTQHIGLSCVTQHNNTFYLVPLCWVSHFLSSKKNLNSSFFKITKEKWQDKDIKNRRIFKHLYFKNRKRFNFILKFL